MNVFSFAGLNVAIDAKYPFTQSRIKKYAVDGGVIPDITLSLDDDLLAEKQRQHPHLSFSECEYMFLGSQLFYEAIDHGVFMLHASAVCLGENGGEAYLFSAPSGTGKSTHTSLWMKAFADKEPYILNDDKPLIYRDGDTYMAAGSPFSGSSDLNENRSVRIKAICFIARGEKNEIKKVAPSKALPLLLDQTVRPKNKDRMIKLLDIIDGLLCTVPVYSMRCLPDEDAAVLAYETMR